MFGPCDGSAMPSLVSAWVLFARQRCVVRFDAQALRDPWKGRELHQRGRSDVGRANPYVAGVEMFL